MNNKLLGGFIGSIFGAPKLGYAFGARMLLCVMVGVPLAIVGGLKALGVEIPRPPEPPKCLRDEMKTYTAIVGFFPVLIAAPVTGPVCVEWEARR